MPRHGDDRSDRQNIQIGKRQAGISIKIFITDIPAADNSYLVVNRVSLVVHAVIHHFQAGDELKIL